MLDYNSWIMGVLGVRCWLEQVFRCVGQQVATLRCLCIFIFPQYLYDYSLVGDWMPCSWVNISCRAGLSKWFKPFSSLNLPSSIFFLMDRTRLFVCFHLLLTCSCFALLRATLLQSAPSSSVPPLPACPLVPFTPLLLAVCYSCWSNLENVPNPLSVLLPQRNTKWIRRDYRLSSSSSSFPSSSSSAPSSSSSPRCHSLLIISPLSCPSFSGHFSSFHRRD